MATENIASPNGPHTAEDDTFERDLKEMLEDGPNLNDSSSPVQTGAANKDSRPEINNQTHMYMKTNLHNSRDTSPAPRLPSSLPSSTIPRSQAVPPGEYPTSTIPLSSPQTNGNNSTNNSKTAKPGAAGDKQTTALNNSKLDTIRAWSLNTYKCTRQIISERFGKGSKTVDLELESQIEALRDTQRKYANILRLARALTNHFYHVVQTQRALGESFSELSQKSPDLQEEFSYNAETQKTLCKNGETLLGAMNFFTSSVNTLCHKTMEDTLQTIRLYEQARVEYDAYRTDVEAMSLGPRDSNTIPKLDDASKKFQAHKEKFDRLRADVNIKLKFLEENKVKVMHKQLLLFHNAISAYFSGNHTALEATLKQFNIKLKMPNADPPSWLEQ